MESRLPLRVGGAARIRLKGQMKHIQHQDILWFLCHPVFVSLISTLKRLLRITSYLVWPVPMT